FQRREGLQGAIHFNGTITYTWPIGDGNWGAYILSPPEAGPARARESLESADGKDTVGGPETRRPQERPGAVRRLRGLPRRLQSALRSAWRPHARPGAKRSADPAGGGNPPAHRPGCRGTIPRSTLAEGSPPPKVEPHLLIPRPASRRRRIFRPPHVCRSNTIQKP